MSEAPRIHHFETGWPAVVVMDGEKRLEGFRLFNWLLLNDGEKWIPVWSPVNEVR